MLMPGNLAALNADQRVMVQMEQGSAKLPKLHVTDSSHATLHGTGSRAPYYLRLAAQARDSMGQRLDIQHAVSERFKVGFCA